MTFIEVLRSEFYYFVEAIEHGSSDIELMNQCKSELKDKTGFVWVD